MAVYKWGGDRVWEGWEAVFMVVYKWGGDRDWEG